MLFLRKNGIVFLLLAALALPVPAALASDEPSAEAQAAEIPAVLTPEEEPVSVLTEELPTPLDGDTTYTINGVSVSLYSSSITNNCYTYANEIYTKIWGSGISSGSNLLRGITSESAHRMTAENIKNYITAAELGASIRLTNASNYNSSSEGAGHSQILVYKDANGFTVLESNVTGGRRERYMTWEKYADWWDGTWGYIQYIRWPGAPAYGGGSSGGGGSSSDTCLCIEEYAGWYVCTTATSSLNIRSGHGTSYSSIGSIPPGAEVYVTRADGVWAHVTYNGVVGYASMSYLRRQETAEDLDEDGRIGEYDAALYLRSEKAWLAVQALQLAVG